MNSVIPCNWRKVHISQCITSVLKVGQAAVVGVRIREFALKVDWTKELKEFIISLMKDDDRIEITVD